MSEKEDIGESSLRKHKEFGGKLFVGSKVPLDTVNDWSLYYTPGVGVVAEHMAANPELAKTHSIKKNTVAVISDGSAVLGLGKIGPYGAIPVMEGKCAIFKSLGDIDAFPIVLDTHNPEEIIETIVRIAPIFGGVNLEDIKAPECFHVEEELKKRLSIPVMHDDQHGTAIVVLAGLLNALKVVGKKKDDVSITVLGAGAAGIAIAHLLKKDGFSDIVVVDSQGVIHTEREALSSFKKVLTSFTTKRRRHRSIEEVVKDSDVLIGVSGPNLISKEMVQSMAEQPIVFALANPIPEIMPDVAKEAGAAVVATGRSDFPNQVNNALVFPGIFRGALDSGVTKITDDMKMKAAHTLAALVENPTAQNIIPSVTDAHVTPAIAKAVHEYSSSQE